MKTVRIILVLALVLIVGDWKASADSDSGVPRLYQVTEGLFRGGQPTPKGFQQLQEKGIRTVINLRVDDSERKLVESLGMRYVHIPIAMPLWSRPWKTIPVADIAAFFEVVADPQNQPVFVHCHRGADRTGMMVGMYRIAYDKWNGAGAYNEAREIGMRWWFRSFKDQLLNFKP